VTTRSRATRLAAVAALTISSVLSGCAAPPLPSATPEVPLEPWELETSLGATETHPPSEQRAGPPETGVGLAKTAPHEKRTQAGGSLERTPRAAVPGGARCLAELEERGIPFERSEPVLGIATPVVLKGAIGGIAYYTFEKKPMVADCRLALSLLDIAPELRALGVERVRYSSTYVYRTSRPGRMSNHAYGLAIDIHAFTVGKTTLEVKRSFERGRGTLCTAGMGPLNLVLCRLRARGIFRELIGPDDNAAHRDHLHLGLEPLPGELAEDLPWPSELNARARSARARSAR
jgi:hypothetical protein